MTKEGRRFDDRVYKRNARFWSYLEIPGGVWLTLFSGTMLLFWIVAFFMNLRLKAAERIEIPTGVTATYIAILTNFAASNIARWYAAVKERISGHATELESPQSS